MAMMTSLKSGSLAAFAGSLLFALAAAGCSPVRSSAIQEERSPSGRARGASGEEPATVAAEPRGMPQVAASPGDGPRSVAVVELFTSEGCSSCPPADDLLHTLASEARGEGKPIYVLSFHVDYWDELGWPDPFSAPNFTERQRAYARVFDTDGLYTPQMVVAGRAGFVGNNEGRARRELLHALTTSAPAAVSLKAKAASGAGALEVSYAVTGAPPGAVLNVALVEAGLVVNVKRGENAGRTLAHENVVRAFETVRIAGEAERMLQVPLPTAVDRAKASVIAYAQDPSTMEVIGATSAGIEL